MHLPPCRQRTGARGTMGLSFDGKPIDVLPRQAGTRVREAIAPPRATLRARYSTERPSTFCHPLGNNPPRVARLPT